MSSRFQLVAGVLLTIAGVSMVRHRSNQALMVAPSLSGFSISAIHDVFEIPTDTDVSIQVYNVYTEQRESQPLFYSWRYSAEPYKVTSITVSGIGHTLEESATIEWAIQGYDEQTAHQKEGRTISHTFTAIGWHNFSLSVTTNAGVLAYAMVDKIMVKYVRREIRDLSELDRTATLDAMVRVYNTPTEEGQKSYGQKYKGIEYFIRMHLYGAADKMCDHWHDDAGIMTHHVGFTIMFEKNMQLVDPSVSIPFWDYTLDAYRYCHENEYFMVGSLGCWRASVIKKSQIFFDDWFGAGSPETPDHAVHRGRWGNTTVLQDAREYSSITNPYGLLRSPWNTDPTAHALRRHSQVLNQNLDPMVSCERWQDCFDSVDLASMNTCLNGATHGPIHILIGGQWFLNSALLENDHMVFQGGLAGDQLLLAKILWRKGYLRCPETCSKDTPAEKCLCSCPMEYRHGATPYEILVDKAEVMHWVVETSRGGIYYNKTEDHYHIMNKTLAEEEVLWNEILLVLCNPGHPGEMYTSAAPYDPTFWLIHPSAERMLSWRRMLDHLSVHTFNQTWGYSHQGDPSDMGQICEWDDVSDFGLPYCYDSTCPGHNAADTTPFMGIVEEGEFPTNEEIYAYVAPWNEELPYMYDTYYWPHCNASGFQMGWQYLPKDISKLNTYLDEVHGR